MAAVEAEFAELMNTDDYGIFAEAKEQGFEAYSGIRNWHRIQGNTSETRTVIGRSRKLEGDGNYTARLNSPVQGTGADGLKQALVLMWESRRDDPKLVAHTRPVLAIHDEIVVEVHADKANDAKAWLTTCMVEGMGGMLKEVPVTVGVEVRQTL